MLAMEVTRKGERVCLLLSNNFVFTSCTQFSSIQEGEVTRYNFDELTEVMRAD